jgi:uncharacterized protein involved in exopolysaccharide biosynthesis
LKQQIAVNEAQLAALLTGGTEQNPQVVRLRSEIANLYGQVDRLQEKTSGSGPTASAAQLPALTMEVERRTRDVKFHETLLQILSRQYENARVDQSYTPGIQLVDRPVLPDEKSWPRRKIMMAFGFIFGGLIGLLFVNFQAARLLSRWKKLMLQVDAPDTSDVPTL